MRFIAEFTGGIPSKNAKGEYEIRFGVIGCPPDVRQVVFFTDDTDSLDKHKTLQEALCTVTREQPRRGLIWVSDEDAWDIDGDFRLYAVAVTGDGKAYTISVMLCDALETRYRYIRGEKISPSIMAAITELRNNDGSKLL